MGQVSTIGLDLAKSIFQVHGADASGAVVFRKRLRRGQVRPFFAAQPPCTVAMEACGSAHYWAREIGMLGHAVRLIPPAYVKPFVKRQKNNATDAEAICEAAQRPTMRVVAPSVVAPKSEQAPKASRPKPQLSYSGRAISWCGSGPKSSMPCAGIWPSSALSWPKDQLMSPSWCRLL
jgi:transposase